MVQFLSKKQRPKSFLLGWFLESSYVEKQTLAKQTLATILMVIDEVPLKALFKPNVEQRLTAETITNDKIYELLETITNN